MNTQSKRKETALYCRTAQFNELAIARQKRDLLAYAKERGFENITFYVDNGFSGNNDDRPGFAKLESNIQNGLVERVIAVDINRISRNAAGAIMWVWGATCMETEFISLDNPMGCNYEQYTDIILSACFGGDE